MSKDQLIKQRNYLLFLSFVTLYIIDVIFCAIVDDITEITMLPLGLGLLIFSGLFIRLELASPRVIMILLIVSYYIVVWSLLIQFPYLVNYMFLLFGIVVCALYHDYLSLSVSSTLSFILLFYFYWQDGDQIFSEVYKSDFIFFPLFALFTTIFLFVYARYTNRLWEDVYQNERTVKMELHSTQEYLQSFFTHSNDAITVVDLQGNVITVNEAFERTYGWKKHEVIGKPFPVILEESRELETKIRELILKGESVIGYETQDRCKDGSIINVEITVSPLYNEAKEVVAISEIARDITERKQLNNRLLDADKLSIAGEMAAGVAHEIRNPLTSIRGFIQLIEEEQNANSTYTAIMKSEITRIDGILNEFLMLAKPHTHQFSSCSINQILSDIILLFETECHLRSVTIDYECNEDAYIQCDSNQLKQVFINLFKNAIESMSDGGRLAIQTKLSSEKDTVTITITDTGSGVPKEILAHIHKPFFTTKTHGTGLGLMVSNKIIAAHEGNLDIQSQQGKGTTISIMFPTVKKAEELIHL
ncbi:PAS domain S-box protein [Metabacillus iocasae]|uniref:histidine kinase n=1 Tax=Priestia iocasae TaxID=2291674 RepID=A0ABS2R167_9BACI|nr:PAS domain S-box protein [Metabacillus iocasae]MBM7704746.1 PAS domain S-box-containing protein [Metabacillus iocasae]